ncbi:hypothetical protein TVAG_478960 [Trichomonas vaginalis G3]|uniref:Uncharacterized protein n=1 Tax=Trichomonas vaginalis (strain ATCC PRA-98 / G3) TaxID=412133 RepID=A2E012_TRIV3|nr:hypothetical protein TVAGG3_0535860 [Trichomonas vaginalis G3]EAY14071.1 hypothetical protein TVAG_478960 [Trichomonas vaginalis G3]KAI5519488.1 hypothetical protein TVAGG3_0535860 [Trichomonas vaginalis G3]|eukprot:XP_001326294.1 hypothetical protein [Trichomonas vaginalis G3]
MSRAIDIRSSIEDARETKKLPALQRRCTTGVSKKSTTLDVNQMKMQIASMELQIRQYKSKTVRLNQKISDSKTAVKRALDKNNESNQVVVASSSTIAQIKENISSLENALDKANSEYNTLRMNDAFYVSQELQEELKAYYLETQRLHNIKDNTNRKVKIVNNEFEVIKQQIESFPYTQREVNSVQDNIDDLISKIDAYTKSETKYNVIEIQKQLDVPNNNAKEIEQKSKLIEQKLKEQVDKLKQDIEKEQERLKNIEKNDQRNMCELQQIVEDQVGQIQAALEIIESQENEEEEESEQEKPQEESKPADPQDDEKIETF